MAMFAVLLTYIDDKDQIARVRPAHRDHLKRQFDAGKLYHAGPYIDDTGGMAIYTAEFEQEVRDILAEDPFTTEGIITDATVKEWQLVFNAVETPS